MRTGLLVSVRDANEARDALLGGADLIDLKEPTRGSLGRVDSAMIGEVVAQVHGRRPISAALGELLDRPAPADLPQGIELAKFGLQGCGPRADWPARLAAAIEQLPAGTGAVGVAYADWRRALAPAPDQVLRQAVKLGCRAILVDTWRKDAGGLLDQWSLEECSEFASSVRSAGLMVVLGGSLDEKAIARLMPLRPDYIAVRGTACLGDRAGRLARERVESLAELVHGLAQPRPSVQAAER